MGSVVKMKKPSAWKRERGGLHRLNGSNADRGAFCERGAELRAWWWCAWTDWFTKYGRELTLADAKAAAAKALV